MTKNFDLLSTLSARTRKTCKVFSLAILLSLVSFGLAQAQTVVVTGADAATNAGSFTTLAAAFTSINATAQTGNAISITITGTTTEPAAGAILNAGTWASMTIAPSGTAVVGGAATAALPLVNFNGASNITINGGNTLTFSNSTNSLTTGTSTITFQNDASNNKVYNTTILGSQATAGISSGVVYFGAGLVTGNIKNKLSGCSIGPVGTNYPSCNVYSLGTSAAIPNTLDTIENCNIYDFTSLPATAKSSAGIALGTGNTNWAVTGNKIYQTVTKMYGLNSHYGILVQAGFGYNISNNIIGYANAAGTGTSNYVGSTAGLPAGFPTSFTTTGVTAVAAQFVGMKINGTEGGTANEIQGNKIANVALYTSSGVTTTQGVWCGIWSLSGNANIGTTTPNIIGSSTSASSNYVFTSSGGGAAAGIVANGTASIVNIKNNIIGGMDVMGSTATISGAFTGIDVAGSIVANVSGNNIGNTLANNIRTGYASTFSNTGTLVTTTATTSPMIGIRAVTTGATFVANNNTLQGWQNGTTLGGALTGIISTGANTAADTINNNQIGTATNDWINYPFANTNTTGTGISLSGSTATSHIIQNNDFRGITYTTSGAMGLTFISLASATAANDVSTISNNTFTNLNLKTTGSITLVSHSISTSATGVLTVDNNRIVTGLTKTLNGGTCYGTYDFGSGATGCVKNITNNNFSNVNLAGCVSFTIFRAEGGSSAITQNITGNVASNWTNTGSGAITGLSVNYFGNNTLINNNTISNINGTVALTGIALGTTGTCTLSTVSNNLIQGLKSTVTGGAVTGISSTCPVGVSVLNINNNKIDTLSNVGGFTVTGILMGGATTTTNTFKNNIYNLTTNNAAGLVNGMTISTGTTTNVYDNFVSDMRTPITSSNTAINGLNITGGTTVNAEHNTIYIGSAATATSTGALFGGAGVYVGSTTTAVNLNNNIVNVAATAVGDAYFSPLKRVSGVAATRPANIKASNNIYYNSNLAADYYYGEGLVNSTATNKYYLTAGTGTADPNFNTSCGLYKKWMPETNTYWEATLNSAAATGTFIPATTSKAESNATYFNSSYLTNTDPILLSPYLPSDFNGVARAQVADCGALEFAGTNPIGNTPMIYYKPLTSFPNTASLCGVNVGATITAALGVNETAGTKPRLWYRKAGGVSAANADVVPTTNDNTTDGWKYVESTTIPDSFKMNYALLFGGLPVAGDSMFYFIDAQDMASTPNVGFNSMTPNACPASVAITSAVFPNTTSPFPYNSFKILSSVTAINATVSNPILCTAGSPILSLTPTPVGSLQGKLLRWQDSTVGGVWANIANATTNPDTIPSISALHYYRCLVYNCDSSVNSLSPSNVLTVSVLTPTIVSTTPATRCGTGTVTLSATGSAGSTLKWYRVAVGDTVINTGANYTTPILSNDSTFYVDAGIPAVNANLTFGTGATISSTYSNPFYSNYSNTQDQYMILASELTAKGAVAGNITSLALEVTSGTTAMADFSVSLAPTTNTTMASLVTAGYTQVYANVSQPTLIGVNTIPFTTPFVWDGTSNIVIKICWGYSGTTATQNNTIKADVTTWVSNNEAHATVGTAGSAECSSSSSYSTYSLRPKTTLACATLCESSPRVAVLAHVLPAPAITPTGTATLCAGGAALPLNVTSATNDPNYTYTWMPGSLAGASQSVLPATTTVYTVNAVDNTTGTNSGCVISSTVTITVNPQPATMVTARKDTTVCPNGIAKISIPNNLKVDTLINENFNGATNNWTTINVSTGGTIASAAWTLEPNNYAYTTSGSTTYTFTSNDASQFYLSNSDQQGASGTLTQTYLVAPSFSTVGYLTDTISFWQDFLSSGTIKVEASTDSLAWTSLYSTTVTTGTATAFVNNKVALSAAFVNKPKVFIRFNYNSIYGYFWALDNVKIWGTEAVSSQWLPLTGLYTDAAATTAYGGGNLLVLYAKPTVTTTYTVTSTNGTCTKTDTARVVVATNPTITATASAIKCFGGTSTIKGIGAAGTSPFVYNLNLGTYNGAAADTFINNAAGTYTVGVKDANTCTATTSITITQPTALSFIAIASTNAKCFGDSSGTITPTATGGTSPYTYTYSPAKKSTGFTAGAYTVTVTDANLCSTTSSVTLTQPASAISFATASTPALCKGASTGAITFNSNTGLAPFTYTVNGAAYNIGNAYAANTYTTAVTDANGCKATNTVAVSEPALSVSVTTTQTNVLCNGGATGTISPTGANGTAPYAYTIAGAGIPSGIAAGTYTVLATDANLCTATIIDTITQPAVLTLSAPFTNITCNGLTNGTITPSASGGTTTYSYLIGGAAPVASYAAGTYTIQVTDANLCTASKIDTLLQPTVLSITASAPAIACKGGNATITAIPTGGTGIDSFNINSGANQAAATFAGNLAASYTVNAKDANGCTASTTLTITEPAVALSVTASAPAVACFGGSSTITAVPAGGTGVDSFNINNGAYQVAATFSKVAGTYTVQTKDANACTASTTITITQPSAALSVTATAPAIACFGGTSTITPTGAGGTTTYTYQVNSAAVANPYAAGTYTVNVTDANACVATTTVVVSQPSVALSVTTSAPAIACKGGNATITAVPAGGTGVDSFNINNGAYQIAATFSKVAGTYTVQTKDANGCTASSTVTVTEPASNVNFTSASTTAAACGSNGTISFAATGGTGTITYMVGSTTTTSPYSAPAGSYVITATDANLCTVTTSVTVSSPSSLAITASATAILCKGANSTLTFNATGNTGTVAYTVNGTSASTGVTKPAGTYTIIATDGATSCSIQTSLTVPEPAVALSVTASAPAIACKGGNSTITAVPAGGTGVDSFNINSSAYQIATTYAGKVAGTYTIQTKDANGCTASTTVAVTEPAVALSVSASAPAIACKGGNVTITAVPVGGTGVDSFNINSSVYQIATTFAGKVAGTYTIQTKDANGCTASTTVAVTEPAVALSVTASAPAIACKGGNVTITAVPAGGTGVDSFNINASAYQIATTFAGKVAGTYTIQTKDANGCTASTTVAVTEPAVALSVTASAPAIACKGGNSTITAVPVGGTGVDSFNINASAYQIATTYAGKVAATYTIQTKDANGCTASTTVAVTEPAVALSVSASAPAIACKGGNVTITAVPTGGTGVDSFNINSSVYQIATTFAGKVAGTYTIQTKDANGCTASTTVAVTEPALALSVTATAPAIACKGGNVTITAVPTGGTGVDSFKLNSGAYQIATTFAANVAGTYTIQTKDAAGCTASTTVAVTEPALALSVTATAPAIACKGGNVTITAVPAGGTGVDSFKLNLGTYQIATTFANNVAGTYTIQTKDANGCTASTTVAVTEPAAALTVTATAPTILCKGSNVTITATGAGGTPVDSFSINAGVSYQIGTTFAGKVAGTYTVQVKDSKGCTNTTSVTITEPAVALSAIATAPAVLCKTGTAVITVVPTGGTGVDSFSINAGVAYQIGTTFTKAAGVYTIQTKDANGCTNTTTVTVTEPAIALGATAVAPAILCKGGTSTITVTPTGGTGVDSFSINAGVAYQLPNTFTNNLAATYTIQVKDANGCTKTTTVAVTEPAVALSVTAAAPAILCKGGAVTITATKAGGTGTDSFSVNAGAYQIGTTFAGKTAGVYTIQAKDANGCIATTSITLTEPAVALSVTASAPSILCKGGTVTITAVPAGGTGVDSFNVNGAANQIATTFAGKLAGTYTVNIKDANACTASTTVVVTEPAVALSAVATAPAVLCNGGNATITVVPTGGTGVDSFSINGGAAYQVGTTFSKAAGTYTVQVKDANGCTNTTTVTVTQPAVVGINAFYIAVLCNGGSTTLSIVGSGGVTPYSFTLNAGTPQATSAFTNTPASATAYTCTVADANGCSKTSIITIANPPLLTVTAASTAILCNGYNSTITATGAGGTGALTYNVNGGTYQAANTFTQPAAAYTVQAKDANACTASTTLTITQPTGITYSVNSTPILCNGNNSNITVTASGGAAPLSYKLNAGTPQTSAVFNNNAAGTYTITITDANFCSKTTTVAITQPATLVASATAPAILCNGNSTTITASSTGGTGTMNYTLNGGTSQTTTTFANTMASATAYTVAVTDANSCTASTTLLISQPTAAVAVTATASAILCNGGNSTITAAGTGGTGVINYNLNGGTNQTATTFANNVANTYTVNATDANACTASTTITITEPTVVGLTLNNSLLACNGGTSNITASATGGTTPFNYTLNGGTSQTSNVFLGKTPGTYTIVATDANGCSKSSTIAITQPNVLTLSLTATNIACNGGTFNITANAAGGTTAYSYTLNGGTSQASNALNGNLAGSYTVVVTDANGCSKSSNVFKANPALMALTTTTSAITCNGGTSTITNSGAGVSYTLNGGTSQTSGVFAGNAAGIYTVVATNATGCTRSTTVTITQPTTVTLSASATPISCNGGTSTISFTQAGGTGTIADTVNNAAVANPYIAGSYTISATDANGCKATTTLSISQPTAIVLAATPTNPTCNGGNGSIAITATGGTGTLTNTVNGAAPAATYTAGTYTVVSTDGSACSVSTTVALTNPAAIVLAATGTNPTCNGGNGSIAITATGGTGTLTNTVNGAAPATTYGAGTYTVVSTDGSACSVSTTVALTNPAAIVLTATGTNPTCFGGNGSIAITATGGTGTLTNTVNGAAPVATYTAGTYTVVSTDGSACSVSTTVALTNPAAIVLAATGTNPTCNGGNGSIAITATGGTGTLTNTVNGAAPAATYTAGTYTVVSTDGSACSVSTTVALTNPAAIVLAATGTNPTCFGGNGSIAITATGGTGTLTNTVNGAAPATTYSAGTYTVVSTDGSACSVSTTVALTNPAAIVLAATGTNPTCNGGNGSIAITATGGTGTLTNTVNGAAPATTYGAGTYTVVSTDGSACSVSTTVALTNPAAIVLAATGTNPTCNGGNGSIAITATGGTGTLTNTVNGAAPATTYGAGTYTVISTDGNACSVSTTVALTNPAAIVLAATGTNPTCNGGNGSIAITATGGTGTLTNTVNGAASATTYGAGTYTVISTDGNACSVSTTVALTNPAAIVLAATGTNPTCNGGNGSIAITATGGTGTLTNTVNGAAPATTYSAGTYTVVSTDGSACSVSTTVALTNPAAIVLAATGTNPTCNGGNGSIAITATGGTGTLTNTVNGAAPATTYVAGTYTVVSTDGSACSVSTTVALTNPAAIVLAATGTNPTCNGGNGSIAITATGGTGTLTNTVNGAAPATTYGAGTYTVISTDGNACSVSTTVALTNPAAIAISANATSTSICKTTTTLLTATGTGLTYTWMPGAATGANDTIMPTATTIYTVTGTDGVCSNTATVQVVVNTTSGDLSQATGTNMLSTAGSSCTTSLQPDGSTVSYFDNNCDLIATVQDISPTSTLGSVTSCVTVDPTVQNVNGQPYLPRHYTITPTTSGPANVTLYYTQDDLNDYNANNGSLPDLPTTGGGTVSMCIYQYTKMLNAPGSTFEAMIPVTLTWDAVGHHWTVTFPVTGFSEFYCAACNPTASPLSVDVVDFAGRKDGNTSLLTWTTLHETNNANFVVKRGTSTLDINTTLGTVKTLAANGTSSSPLNYSYVDEKPNNGHNYYQLQQVDIDGKVNTVNKIVDVYYTDGATVTVYPNPTQDDLHVDINIDRATQATIKIMDVAGKTIKTIETDLTKGINKTNVKLSELVPGTYLLKVIDGKGLNYSQQFRKM